MADMSPLARLLRDKQREGMSFREMERVALQAGYRFTSSSFEQVAKDARARRLGLDAIKALSVVLGISASRVAELDDERWGLTRRDTGTVDLSDPRLSDADRQMILSWLRERGIDPRPARNVS